MSGDASVLWFVGTALLTAAAWAAGVWLGRGGAWRGRLTIGFGVLAVIGWGWLVRHPAAAVAVVPVGVLSRVEGVGGVPWFMLILGAAWSRAALTRQRVVIAWAMMFGAVYFVHGGRWLLQETPAAVMGQTTRPYAIRQSRDYSCVPAACATALNLLGVPSTEKQMAELTQTRPGTGATVVRALDGLSQRLRGTGVTPRLLEVEPDAIGTLPLPLLTPLQFVAGRRHMVVVTRIDRRGYWVMDPTDGLQHFDRDAFAEVFRDQVIVFTRE
ncbi:MAG: cysteine peptidase family C39 domain-containing protein [Planctomycetota bacterium]